MFFRPIQYSLFLYTTLSELVWCIPRPQKVFHIFLFQSSAYWHVSGFLESPHSDVVVAIELPDFHGYPPAESVCYALTWRIPYPMSLRSNCTCLDVICLHLVAISFWSQLSEFSFRFCQIRVSQIEQCSTRSISAVMQKICPNWGNLSWSLPLASVKAVPEPILQIYSHDEDLCIQGALEQAACQMQICWSRFLVMMKHLTIWAWKKFWQVLLAKTVEIMRFTPVPMSL